MMQNAAAAAAAAPSLSLQVSNSGRAVGMYVQEWAKERAQGSLSYGMVNIFAFSCLHAKGAENAILPYPILTTLGPSL